MKIIKIILISISALIFILIGFLFLTKSNIKVIKAETNHNFKGIYPPNCFYKFRNEEYLIENVYVYKNKILNEFWFIGSEGFAVQKFNLLEHNYSNEEKPYRFLNYNTDKSYIYFNSKKYKIDYTKGDTIISKIDSKKIIMFIDK